jgi:integrase
MREAAGTKAEADALLERRRLEVTAADAGAAPFTGGAERLRVSALVDAAMKDKTLRGIRSIRALRSHAKALLAVLGGTRAVSVTGTTVAAYVASRREDGVSDATLDRELELLRGAFRLAHANRLIGWTLQVPKLVGFRENAREVSLSPGQVRAILDGITSAGFRDALEFFSVTGWRPREIGTLEWSMLDRARGILRLHPRNAKSKRGRSVPVAGPLVAILARREKARRLDCPLLFHDAGKSVLAPAKRGGFRDALLRHEWHPAVEAARMADPELWRDTEDVRPYDLRRSARLALALAGVDPAVSMLILGHESAPMHASYLSTEAMARALSTKDTTRTQRPHRNGGK